MKGPSRVYFVVSTKKGDGFYFLLCIRCCYCLGSPPCPPCLPLSSLHPTSSHPLVVARCLFMDSSDDFTPLMTGCIRRPGTGRPSTSQPHQTTKTFRFFPLRFLPPPLPPLSLHGWTSLLFSSCSPQPRLQIVYVPIYAALCHPPWLPPRPRALMGRLRVWRRNLCRPLSQLIPKLCAFWREGLTRSSARGFTV